MLSVAAELCTDSLPLCTTLLLSLSLHSLFPSAYITRSVHLFYSCIPHSFLFSVSVFFVYLSPLSVFQFISNLSLLFPFFLSVSFLSLLYLTLLSYVYKSFILFSSITVPLFSFPSLNIYMPVFLFPPFCLSPYLLFIS